MTMLKLFIEILLIVCGFGLAAIGAFFYFVGGVCGPAPDALQILIFGLLVMCVGFAIGWFWFRSAD